MQISFENSSGTQARVILYYMTGRLEYLELKLYFLKDGRFLDLLCFNGEQTGLGKCVESWAIRDTYNLGGGKIQSLRTRISHRYLLRLSVRREDLVLLHYNS